MVGPARGVEVLAQVPGLDQRGVQRVVPLVHRNCVANTHARGLAYSPGSPGAPSSTARQYAGIPW